MSNGASLRQQTIVKRTAQHLVQLFSGLRVRAVVNLPLLAVFFPGAVGIREDDLDVSLALLQGSDEFRIGEFIERAITLSPVVSGTVQEARKRSDCLTCEI